MKKTLRYCIKAFQFGYAANGYHALLYIFSQVYERSLFPLIQIILLAKFLDYLAHSHETVIINLPWIVITYLLASILKLYFASYAGAKSGFLDIKLDTYLDYLVCKKLTELDPARFEDSEFQDLLAQIDGVKTTVQMHLVRFTYLISAATNFITSGIIVAAVFPLFIPLIILATIPSYIVWDKFRIKTFIYYFEKRSGVIRVTQYIKGLLSSDSTSKEATIFKTGKILLNKIRSKQSEYYDEFNNELRPWTLYLVLARIVQLAAFTYTQFLNIASVLAGTLGVGQFTLFFTQTLQLTLSSEEVLNQYSSIASRNKYLDKFFEFLNTEKVVHTPSTPLVIPPSPNPPVIQFKKVSFMYPNTDRYIFKNFSLTIQSGEKIAFVGENGTGKTTLIKLLLRFYDVNEGEILINGLNIKEINLHEWHKYIGALFQDFIKYQFTFEENIAYGNSEKKPTKKLLQEAIEKSGASGYLNTLPKKYKQTVGKMFDGGIDLSGGQWQKLALARAFFRDAPILILDEPTSAIDAKAEFEIFEKVQNLQKDKTVIIISHRFSTVRNADRIIVLSEGKIFEEGTHKELIKKNSLYAELFNIQAQGYK
ncbi:MAG: ABC transporter ATP-binding protein/permease [bacterium]|nr:ABC transporter ATP-binding protein/permease [bacterium]